MQCFFWSVLLRCVARGSERGVAVIEGGARVNARVLPAFPSVGC